MDIVLEIADTFLLDKLYANLFPASLSNNLPSNLKPYFNNFNSTSPFSSENTLLASKLSASGTWSTIFETIEGVGNIPERGNDIYGLSPTHFFPETCYTYASMLPRSNMIRQAISLSIIMCVFGWLLYFVTASVSYYLVFDKSIFNHPRYLKNQMSLEIKQASSAIPIMVLLTLPWFLLELRGYSKLYLNVDETTGGWKAVAFQYVAFILFTDCGIYFIHRILHYPPIYKKLHKPHHKWIVCTPFASHAFHPVDGYMQSLPYHWYPFIFPLHKISYLFLFTFVNFWTVMIHDGEYLSNDPVVNGAACHTVHHLYFNYNYGQFTTLWDRLGGSYRKPDQELFDRKAKVDKNVWNEQAKKMDVIRNEVEGKNDDRIYGTEETLKRRVAKKL
ncbi:hypothetical protein PACTADRAFT_50135 [Pachysolen tannophilus NRRL Y-2460]|uniref:Fatty acid hydroxylase domain-containing protein n=1 Tax=Pachysolen tannophilus NRRL Y-2460 TaxID=669874 RepID=A0A1E4TUI8_PACTA|nr:hypothetical protein PACTADRAFT_50135 [Pachysolen tannophilus NRRL Y-2460]